MSGRRPHYYARKRSPLLPRYSAIKSTIETWFNDWESWNGLAIRLAVYCFDDCFFACWFFQVASSLFQSSFDLRACCVSSSIYVKGIGLYLPSSLLASNGSHWGWCLRKTCAYNYGYRMRQAKTRKLKLYMFIIRYTKGSTHLIVSKITHYNIMAYIKPHYSRVLIY